MEYPQGKAKADAMSYIQQHIEEAKLTAQQEAKKIVINTHSANRYRRSHR